jgi:hypothetical protein
MQKVKCIAIVLLVICGLIIETEARRKDQDIIILGNSGYGEYGYGGSPSIIKTGGYKSNGGSVIVFGRRKR